jgi:hypothetical protein
LNVRQRRPLSLAQCATLEQSRISQFHIWSILLSISSAGLNECGLEAYMGHLIMSQLLRLRLTRSRTVCKWLVILWYAVLLFIAALVFRDCSLSAQGVLRDCVSRCLSAVPLRFAMRQCSCGVRTDSHSCTANDLRSKGSQLLYSCREGMFVWSTVRARHITHYLCSCTQFAACDTILCSTGQT